jgi:hypothetical protein
MPSSFVVCERGYEKLDTLYSLQLLVRSLILQTPSEKEEYDSTQSRDNTANESRNPTRTGFIACEGWVFGWTPASEVCLDAPVFAGRDTINGRPIVKAETLEVANTLFIGRWASRCDDDVVVCKPKTITTIILVYRVRWFFQ